MIVYNSLGRPYTGMVRVPVIKEGISVTDPDGNTIPVQVIKKNMTVTLSYIISS